MAKPRTLRQAYQELDVSPLSAPIVDQPSIGGIGQVDLWGPQAMNDLPDWSGLSKTLVSAYVQLKKEDQKEEFEKGKAFATSNRQAFKDAVKEGSIPKGADPYFISGARTVTAKRYHDEVEKLFNATMEEKTKEALDSQSQHLPAQKPLPVPEEVLAQVRERLSTELQQGNPTLAGDKWFLESLSDLTLKDEDRIIHNAKVKVDKANEKILGDIFTVDIINGLNKVSDGEMTMDEFNTNIVTGSIYSSNIDNPQAFVWNAAQAAYQAELRNVDQDTGEPKNPARLKSLYSSIGQIKLGQNLLVDGPMSDNYTSMSGTWTNKMTAADRADAEWSKHILDPNSPFHNIAISKDMDFTTAETRRVLDILATDPESIGVTPSRAFSIMERTRKMYSDKQQDVKPVDNSARIAEVQGLAMLGKTQEATTLANSLPIHDRVTAMKKVQEATEGVTKDIFSNKTYKDKIDFAKKTARAMGVDTTPGYLNAFSDFSDVMVEHAHKRISETGKSDPTSIGNFLNEGLSKEEVTKFLTELKTKKEEFRKMVMTRNGEDLTDLIEQKRYDGLLDEKEYDLAVKENKRNVSLLTQLRGTTGKNVYRSTNSNFQQYFGMTYDEKGVPMMNPAYYEINKQTGQKFITEAGRAIVNKAKTAAMDRIHNAIKNGGISTLEELYLAEKQYPEQEIRELARNAKMKLPPNMPFDDEDPEDEVPEKPNAQNPPVPIPPKVRTADPEVVYDAMNGFINKYSPPQYRKSLRVQSKAYLKMLNVDYLVSNEASNIDLNKSAPLERNKIWKAKEDFTSWFGDDKNLADRNTLMKRYGYNPEDEISQLEFFINHMKAY